MQVGPCLRNHKSMLHRDVRLPEFELGYETVDRRCVPVPRA